MGITVKPLSDMLGAEIGGINTSGDIDDTTMGKITVAFSEHSVLLFRGQDLTPKQHISLSQQFGPLEFHVSKQYLLPEHPEILVLSNEKRADGSRVSIADGGGKAATIADGLAHCGLRRISPVAGFVCLAILDTDTPLDG